MSFAFSHVYVLLSLITGFGITEVLSNWGQMIRQRDQVKEYWLHFLWVLIGLLILIQTWWATWDLRTIEAWGFLDLLLELVTFLAPIIALFVLIPDFGEPEDRDLRRYYWHNKRWFFLLAGATLVILSLQNIFILDLPLLHVENYIRAAALGLMLILAFSEREWVHVAVLITAFVLFAAFIVQTLTVIS